MPECDHNVSNLQRETRGQSQCGRPLPKSEENPPASVTLEQSGYHIEFRLPNGFDLLALDQDANTTHDRMRLLQRCVLNARRETDEIPAANLPEEIVTAIVAKMAEADPQADMLISLRCPNVCTGGVHRWTSLVLLVRTRCLGRSTAARRSRIRVSLWLERN